MAHPAASAEFRFYEELNDFLPPERRRVAFRYSVAGTRSVKDAIEAIGVPHTEVDLILVDGHSVGFDRVLRGACERFQLCPGCGRIYWEGTHYARLRRLLHPAAQAGAGCSDC